jgi:aryl-alcohol dehydrogenase-like predicted oxidoreductase
MGRRRAVTESLRRLRTDYIDLYQIHTPDPVTPIDETISALDELVTEGKVRYTGWGHAYFLRGMRMPMTTAGRPGA